MAKLAVIVPVYNVEAYLKKCIESIIGQSFKDFRLILINDGSTDDSGDICDFYEKQDPRITVIHQANQGLSMARNKGIEESTEDYISFIDSDDAIHKDMLKILYNNLIENQGDVSICGYKPVYEGQVLEDQAQVNNVSLLNNIAAVNRIVEENDTMMIIAWGKIYKTSLFKNIRYPKGKYHEDEFVTYRVLYDAKRVVVTDAKLYYYTQRKESITGDRYSLKRLEKLEGLEEAIYFFKKRNETDLGRKAEIRYLLNIQIAYYRVKYEMSHQPIVLEKLKREYDQGYKELIEDKKNIPIIAKVKLLMFYRLPEIYCSGIKLYMSLLKEKSH